MSVVPAAASQEGKTLSTPPKIRRELIKAFAVKKAFDYFRSRQRTRAR